MAHFVSIIVPVKNELKYIIECVNSLLNVDYPKNSYEIIVVLDKNATAEVERALSTFRGRIKVVRSKRSGSAANRNLGVMKADKRAAYFAFTDADCIVSKNWLGSLVHRINNSSKDIGCVGGLNLVPESDNQFAKLIGAIEQTLLGGGGSAQSAVTKRMRIVQSIPNCNALYRKELWIKNKQDENLIIGQDGEFNYRLGKQGNKFLIIPNAVVWHHRTNSIRKHVRRMYKYGEAAARVFKLHPGILKARWYASLSLFGMALVIILFVISFSSILALYLLEGLVIAYLAMLLLTTLQVIVKLKKPIAIFTPFILALQHLFYNIGFMAGLVEMETRK